VSHVCKLLCAPFTYLLTSWRFSVMVTSFLARTKLLNVNTGMDDHLLADIPLWNVTKPTRSAQLCIPPGSLNRVPALTGLGKGGNITSVGWQVTLCDPIWHASSRSDDACCILLYPVKLKFHGTVFRVASSWHRREDVTRMLRGKQFKLYFTRQVRRRLGGRSSTSRGSS